MPTFDTMDWELAECCRLALSTNSEITVTYEDPSGRRTVTGIIREIRPLGPGRWQIVMLPGLTAGDTSAP